MNHRFAGRSASLRTNHGYQNVPYATRTLEIGLRKAFLDNLFR